MGDKLLARTVPGTKAERLESSPLVIVEARINAQPSLGDEVFGTGEVG